MNETTVKTDWQETVSERILDSLRDSLGCVERCQELLHGVEPVCPPTEGEKAGGLEGRLSESRRLATAIEEAMSRLESAIQGL